jgi:hypothetical protein
MWPARCSTHPRIQGLVASDAPRFLSFASEGPIETIPTGLASEDDPNLTSREDIGPEP